jgi:predicted AlkP superfamily phosphohydrolase/phosphomutase
VVIAAPGEPLENSQVIGVGEWSDWYGADFTLKPDSDGVWMRGWIGPGRAERRDHKATCRFHVSALSPDGANLVLERTHLFTTYEWTHPPELGDVLRTQLDLGITSESVAGQVQRLGAEALVAEYAWLNDYRLRAKRLVRIIEYLQDNGGWDLCYLHFHLMDSVNHRFLTFLAPEFPGYSVDQANAARRQYEEAYTIVDDFTGDLLARCVDDETLVILVSDHAAVPTWRFTNVASVLVQAGLLAYRWVSERERYEVDWAETKAYPYVTPPFIWVNLKGRDPQGIVDPDDYDAVRRQIINALLDWEDKQTGDRPILAAIPREDAAILGLIGDRVGDVVYFLNPQYQPWDGDITHEWPYFLTPDRFEQGDVRESRKVFGTHDHVSPTAQVGSLTVRSVLIMNGPGIRKGFRAAKPVRLIDVAPTISHLLGIPTPAQSEGAVLSSFLAD